MLVQNPQNFSKWRMLGWFYGRITRRLNDPMNALWFISYHLKKIRGFCASIGVCQRRMCYYNLIKRWETNLLLKKNWFADICSNHNVAYDANAYDTSVTYYFDSHHLSKYLKNSIILKLFFLHLKKTMLTNWSIKTNGIRICHFNATEITPISQQTLLYHIIFRPITVYDFYKTTSLFWFEKIHFKYLLDKSDNSLQLCYK